MLSRKKCKQAIKNWTQLKTDYTKIQSIFNKTASFTLSAKDCKWLYENNDDSSFRGYVGFLNKKLLLIVIPRDVNGNEKKLKEYIALPYLILSESIELRDKEVVTFIKKAHLSADLEITDFKEEVSRSVYNQPSLSEAASLEDIYKWRHSALDWFMFQNNDNKGKRIFNFFDIPLFDLDVAKDGLDGIQAFFALKKSEIYNQLLPTLIFVESVNESSWSYVLNASNSSNSNSKDYSRPCPPMCPDPPTGSSFNL